MQHKELLEWYSVYGRHDLPWRNTAEIYHIYLSEVMLQQTQVKRVEEEYYPQFLEKFPTLYDLAQANEESVLAAWSGLGYYSRARNLHATAKLTHEAFPTSYDELVKLPGIGAYTASAICAFGYRESRVVLDTNIKRVMKRYLGLIDATDKKLYQESEALLYHKEPREYNLALMDLGSLVCVPKNPQCSSCPLAASCVGKADPQRYTTTKKSASIAMDLFYGIYVKDGAIALQESAGSMYKGMLELPSIDPLEDAFLGSFKHAYTKYRLTVKLYVIDALPKGAVLYPLEKLQHAPISSLVKKALKYLL